MHLTCVPSRCLPRSPPPLLPLPCSYHTDNSDTVALLCLHDAEDGGITNWTSSLAVHNALLRRGRKVRRTCVRHCVRDCVRDCVYACASVCARACSELVQ